jgi:hypothetical protein
MKASNAFCAIQIELFPFRYPITSATEYFGGIENQHMHMVGQQVPFLNLAFLAPSKLMEYSAQVLPDLPKQRLLAVLRREHDMVLALPCRVIQLIMIL